MHPFRHFTGNRFYIKFILFPSNAHLTVSNEEIFIRSSHSFLHRSGSEQDSFRQRTRLETIWPIVHGTRIFRKESTVWMKTHKMCLCVCVCGFCFHPFEHAYHDTYNALNLRLVNRMCWSAVILIYRRIYLLFVSCSHIWPMLKNVIWCVELLPLSKNYALTPSEHIEIWWETTVKTKEDEEYASEKERKTEQKKKKHE